MNIYSENVADKFSVSMHSIDSAMIGDSAHVIKISVNYEGSKFMHIVEPGSLFSRPLMHIKKGSNFDSGSFPEVLISPSGYNVLIIKPHQEIVIDVNLEVANDGKIVFANGLQEFNLDDGLFDIRIELPLLWIDYDNGTSGISVMHTEIHEIEFIFDNTINNKDLNDRNSEIDTKHDSLDNLPDI